MCLSAVREKSSLRRCCRLRESRVNPKIRLREGRRKGAGMEGLGGRIMCVCVAAVGRGSAIRHCCRLRARQNEAEDADESGKEAGRKQGKGRAGNSYMCSCSGGSRRSQTVL